MGVAQCRGRRAHRKRRAPRAARCAGAVAPGPV